MTSGNNAFMKACEDLVSEFKAKGVIENVATMFNEGGQGERLASLTNEVGRENALAILLSEIDCDSDYEDSVAFMPGEINRIFARSNLPPKERVQFRKRMEELEVEAKADPGGESATLIKEMRARHKASEKLRNLKIEISAIYEVIESELSYAL